MNKTPGKVPTEEEIATAENNLNRMKKLRSMAMQRAREVIKSDEALSLLTRDQLMALSKRIQQILSGGHRRIRGCKVPPELKASLITAIQSAEYSLNQLSEMFNLSISYISRIKHELRKANQLAVTRGMPESAPRIIDSTTGSHLS